MTDHIDDIFLLFAAVASSVATFGLLGLWFGLLIVAAWCGVASYVIGKGS